jgi:hypothetical protein
MRPLQLVKYLLFGPPVQIPDHSTVLSRQRLNYSSVYRRHVHWSLHLGKFHHSISSNSDMTLGSSSSIMFTRSAYSTYVSFILIQTIIILQRCSSLKIFPSLISVCLIRRSNQHLSAAYCIHCPLFASLYTSAGQSFNLYRITRSSNLTVLAIKRDCIRNVRSLSPSMLDDSELPLQCRRVRYDYR